MRVPTLQYVTLKFENQRSTNFILHPAMWAPTLQYLPLDYRAIGAPPLRNIASPNEVHKTRRELRVSRDVSNKRVELIILMLYL